MPEGHTIHRHARKQREVLAGHVVAATSPQGRFTAGARRINGRHLNDIEAHGKHLFYRWETGEVLHVHLGLFGKFRTHYGEPPNPTNGTRLTLSTGEVSVYLAGPTICELIGPPSVDAILARLGPDPLRDGAGAKGSKRFAENLTRRRIPIGAALLDQSVIAGIGNVYRAETLFLSGIDPATPSSELSEASVDGLWASCVENLRRGVRMGRIVTVEPRDAGARRRSDIRRDQRLYVYKRHRESCRRCGTAIATTEMANRRIWWCPSCQPPGAGA